MCVTCAREMQREVATIGEQDQRDVLTVEAQQVLDILAHDGDSYAAVMTMLAVMFALYPLSLVQLMTEVSTQMMEGGGQVKDAVPIDMMLNSYSPRATH